jgi:hypothetical protein
MKHSALFTSGLLGCVLLFAQQAGANPPKAQSMKREIIRIPNAPSSPLYSQAVKVGSTIYVTGILGLDPTTNKVAGPTIQDQTRQALIRFVPSRGSAPSSASCWSRSR